MSQDSDQALPGYPLLFSQSSPKVAEDQQLMGASAFAKRGAAQTPASSGSARKIPFNQPHCFTHQAVAQAELLGIMAQGLLLGSAQ